MDSDGVIGIGLQDSYSSSWRCYRGYTGDVGAGSTSSALIWDGKLVGRQAWILVQNSAAMNLRKDQNLQGLVPAPSGFGYTEEPKTHCALCKNDVGGAYRCPAGRELAPFPLVANRAR